MSGHILDLARWGFEQSGLAEQKVSWSVSGELGLNGLQGSFQSKPFQDSVIAYGNF